MLIPTASDEVLIVFDVGFLLGAKGGFQAMLLTEINLAAKNDDGLHHSRQDLEFAVEKLLLPIEHIRCPIRSHQPL